MADQITMVTKVLKVFPKGFKISQALLNQTIKLVNDVIAYNGMQPGNMVLSTVREGESK